MRGVAAEVEEDPGVVNESRPPVHVDIPDQSNVFG
jgi:hypothetical protein